MNGASVFFVVALALAVTALPSRLRRQFDWNQFEGSNSGFDNNWDNNAADSVRIPRQRVPESWGRGNPNWDQASGRQLPQNFGGNTDLDNGFNNGDSFIDNTFNQGFGNGVSTPTTGSTTTKASATYTNCMNACQFTRQYNPVCGTDGNTYSNRHELNCAFGCGRVVQLSRGGTCQPL